PAAPMMISPSTASPPIEWRKARRAAPGLGPSTRPVSTRRLRAARVSASRNSASFSSAAWPYAVPTSDGTLPIKASPCGTAVAAVVATAAMPTWENRPSIAVRVFGPSSERLSRSGSRPPSHTPDAIRCRASEVTSQTASMPPAAPAWPIQPCKASAAPVSTAAATLRPPRKDSSGSAAASKASRTSADWPNRVCSATTGTAEARSARVWEPAIAAACATSQQTPDSKANTPLNRLSRSSRRCKAPVADGSMFSAAGRTEALNTVTPSSDSIAAICRLRKPVSRTSNQLMSRGDGKHELPFRLVRIHRGHVPDDGVFAGRQLAQPHDKLPAVLLCMHVTRIQPFVRGVAHLDLTEARLHRFGEGDGDGRGRVRHLAADRGDGTVEEGVREGGRTRQHQHDGRNEQALHRSPPFHDRLAEAVRQQIVKVEMELRDHPDMRTGLLVAGDQRLDAERIGVCGVVDAHAKQVLRRAVVRLAGGRGPRHFYQRRQPVDEFRQPVILHLRLQVADAVLERQSTNPSIGDAVVGRLSVRIDLQLLVGDLVAELPGDGERTQPADRQITQPLAEEELRRRGAAVVVIQRRAVGPCRTGARELPFHTHRQHELMLGVHIGLVLQSGGQVLPAVR